MKMSKTIMQIPMRKKKNEKKKKINKKKKKQQQQCTHLKQSVCQ